MSLSNKLLARFRMALPLVRNRAAHMPDAFCALLRRRRRLAVAAGLLALPLAALLLWLAFAPCPQRCRFARCLAPGTHHHGGS